ncbi:hypothetical protein FQR65_LT09530 [Abscondita terminalis]|nr:hypothetical protein FQR65_LT09530 [Abscondita terminalis]
MLFSIVLLRSHPLPLSFRLFSDTCTFPILSAYSMSLVHKRKQQVQDYYQPHDLLLSLLCNRLPSVLLS